MDSFKYFTDVASSVTLASDLICIYLYYLEWGEASFLIKNKMYFYFLFYKKEI